MMLMTASDNPGEEKKEGNESSDPCPSDADGGIFFVVFEREFSSTNDYC